MSSSSEVFDPSAKKFKDPMAFNHRVLGKTRPLFDKAAREWEEFMDREKIDIR